ncbi:MAG: hypothetical protein RLZ32_2134 [Gemmatimonadota bacterium]
MPPMTQLLIIDPQHDFCDLPAGACPPGEAPALPVPGADADLRRLAAFLEGRAARGARVVSSTVLAAELQPRVAAGPAGLCPS